MSCTEGGHSRRTAARSHVKHHSNGQLSSSPPGHPPNRPHKTPTRRKVHRKGRNTTLTLLALARPPLPRTSHDNKQHRHHLLHIYRISAQAPAVLLHNLHRRRGDRKALTTSRASKSVLMTQHGKSCLLLSRNTRSTTMTGKIMLCSFVTDPQVGVFTAFYIEIHQIDCAPL